RLFVRQDRPQGAIFSDAMRCPISLDVRHCTPAITACYQRLRASGKPPKVARCAAARKLLHQAWALGSKRQRFDPGYHQQQHEALPQLAA
ncbi:MAG TPA: hypothetical protein VLA19_12985, partial [Herpetosiphonaceae bacterium]|nr:hypothetical protein [Herpetosiphonaceae bacterium]